MTDKNEWPSIDQAINGLIPRNERRIMVRVKVRPQNGHIVGGALVPQGEHVALVYESEIGRLAGYVWNDKHRTEVAGARDQYERELAEWTRTSKAASRDVAEATFGRSLEAVYYDRTREQIPPIESIDINPVIFSPPDTPETRVDRSQRTIEEAIVSLAKGQEMIAEALGKTRNVTR
jgi:hypothetical protein